MPTPTLADLSTEQDRFRAVERAAEEAFRASVNLQTNLQSGNDTAQEERHRDESIATLHALFGAAPPAAEPTVSAHPVTDLASFRTRLERRVKSLETEGVAGGRIGELRWVLDHLPVA